MKVRMTEYVSGNLTHFRVHWWTSKGYSSASTWHRPTAVALRDGLIKQCIVFGLSLAIIVTVCILLTLLDDFARNNHYTTVARHGDDHCVPFIERPQPTSGAVLC